MRRTVLRLRSGRSTSPHSDRCPRRTRSAGPRAGRGARPSLAMAVLLRCRVSLHETALRSEQVTRDRYAIRGYLSTVAKHGAHVLTALRDALAGNPWMPPIPDPP